MLVFILTILSCNSAPTKLPAEKLSQIDKNAENPLPLYQMLYDGHPQSSIEQQRVRIFLWLKHMNFDKVQLKALEGLRKEVVARQNNIEEKEKEYLEQFLEEETPIYNEIWDKLLDGKNSFEKERELLQNIRSNRDTKKDLLKLRVLSIQSIFKSEIFFLKQLSPAQEQKIVDALLFLRHMLDPVGSPGDFEALIGTTYEPGQYAVLTRGTSQLAQQSLNFGGLWTDKDQLSGKELHEARREVILYFILLEPALEEALRASLDK
jgi:hypothetical protein